MTVLVACVLLEKILAESVSQLKRIIEKRVYGNQQNVDSNLLRGYLVVGSAGFNNMAKLADGITEFRRALSVDFEYILLLREWKTRCTMRAKSSVYCSKLHITSVKMFGCSALAAGEISERYTICA